MVAPYEIGDPVRSYVRVPGSGTDKTAKSLCCDLSRVSPVAAAAPIPSNHVQEPQVTTTDRPAPVQDVNMGEKTPAGNLEKTGKTKEKGTQAEIHREETQVPSQGTQDGRHQDDKCVTNPRKRACQAEEVNDEDGKSNAVLPLTKRARVTAHGASNSSLVGDNGISGSVGIDTVRCESSLSSIGTQTSDLLSEVVRERNQLKEQNILLERRLSVFKDIFRNKNRLARLLRALEVEAPC